MPPLNLYARVRISCVTCTRDRGVQRAPGIPCALCFLGEWILHRSGILCRGNADVCLNLSCHCEPSGAHSRDPFARNDEIEILIRRWSRDTIRCRPGLEPGPITTNVDVARSWSGSLCVQRGSVAMGPRFRGDDVERWDHVRGHNNPTTLPAPPSQYPQCRCSRRIPSA